MNLKRAIETVAYAASLGVLLAGAAFAGESKVTLSGGEETPPVATAAAGNGSVIVNDDHSVSGTIVTRGLVGTMAHIHVGAPGKAGPPIITLTKVSDHEWSVPVGSKLTDDQYKSYKAGELYVNVHTAEHKGGEIRAQLQP
jgi:hypothetical protein